MDSTFYPAASRNAELLHSIIQPYIKSGTEAHIAQSDNLTSIILEGAHFGLLLFSQPTIWIFGWEKDNANQGGSKDRRSRSGAGKESADRTLVVFPSIGKVVTIDRSKHVRVVVDAMLERV
jgi:hypothetical protein